MPPVQVRAPDGSVVNVEEQDLRQAIDAGYRVISPDEAHRAYIAEKYSGTGNVIGAALSSAASTATFGLSDVLLSQSPSIRKALQAYEELYPEAKTVGGIAGAFVPSPGSFLGGLAEKGITKLAGEGASLGARALATGGGLAARGLAEGAYIGGGSAIGESVIHNIPLTSEKLASGLLHGAALGAGLSLGIGVPLHALGAAGRGVLKHLARGERTVEDVAEGVTTRAQSTLERAERDLAPPGADPLPEPRIPTDRPMTLNSADLMEVGPPGPAPKRPAKPNPVAVSYLDNPEAMGMKKGWINDIELGENAIAPWERLPTEVSRAGEEGDKVLALRNRYPELSPRELRAKYNELQQGGGMDVGAAAESPEVRLGAEDVTGGKPAARPVRPAEFMDIPELATGEGGIERFGEKRAWKGRTPAEEAEYMRIQAQKAENARARIQGINERGGVVRHIVEHVDKRAQLVDELVAAEKAFEAEKAAARGPQGDEALQKRLDKAQQQLDDLDAKLGRRQLGRKFEEDLRAAREEKVANDSAAKKAAREQAVLERQARKDEAHRAKQEEKVNREYERAIKEHENLKPKDPAGEAWDAKYQQEHGVEAKKAGYINPWIAGAAGSMLGAPLGISPILHGVGMLAAMGYNMAGKTKAIQHIADKVTRGLDANVGKLFRGARGQAIHMSAAAGKMLSNVEQQRYALNAVGSNPDAVRNQVNDALHNVAGAAPNVRDKTVEAVLRVQEVMREYMPPPNSSRALNAEYLRIVEILQDPSKIYQNVKKGTVTKKQGQAFQKAYPERYGELVDRIVQESIELQAAGLTLPRKSVTSLSILLDKPLTIGNSAPYAATISAVYQTLAGAPPPPAQAAPQQNTHTPEFDFTPTKDTPK